MIMRTILEVPDLRDLFHTNFDVTVFSGSLRDSTC
jgi:hypothetical protein